MEALIFAERARMFRPVPGIFLGSSPQDGLPEGNLPNVLNSCFGALATLAALAVWIAAYIVDGHANPITVLKLSCAAMLAPSLLGLWAVRRAESEPQRMMHWLFASMTAWRAQPRHLAAPQAIEGGWGCFAGLIGQLTRRSEQLARREQAAKTTHEAVLSGHAETGRLALILQDEAASLSEAATQVEAFQALVTQEVSANAGSLASGDMACDRVTNALARLTDRVEATTAHAAEMAATAVRSSELAHATQKTVADQEDGSSRLKLALDQIEQAMSRMAQPEECQPALAAAHAAVRDLVAENSGASHRMLELAELIAAQHALGQALSHSVQQQAIDIGAALTDIYEARSGFIALRAGVAAITHAGAQQSDAAGRVRQAALRLPSQAERMADILRGIPDFGRLDEI